MRNKILGSLLVVAIAAVAAFNVSMNVESTNSESTNLTLVEVEALAENEMNSWRQWFTQGLTKDEREETRPCPSETSSNWSLGFSYRGYDITGTYSTTDKNSSDRYEVVCPSGNKNCTPVSC